jgi:hypothetical protein
MKKFKLVLLITLLPGLFSNCGSINCNASDNGRKKILSELAAINRVCSRQYNASPLDAAWPNENNTGPSGPLTPYAPDGGILFTDHDNQIIENLEIHGIIAVSHNNVTIRNCDIYGIPNQSVVISCYNYGGPHVYGLLIEDCRIDGNGIDTGVVTGRNYTIRRCEIFHAAQLIKFANGRAVIEDNYLHDVWGHYPDSHNVGVGTNGESDTTDAMDITIRNNNINAATTDCMGGSSAAISLWGDFGQISNVLIEHNRVAVGVDESYYMIAAGSPTKPYPHSTNIRIINNVLVYTERVGRVGGIMFFEDANGNVASGNTWEDTGATIIPNPGGYGGVVLY